jgi:hypothetical protein
MNYIYILNFFRNLSYLKARIREADELALKDMIPHIWYGNEYSHICRVSNPTYMGTYVGNYLTCPSISGS